VAEKKKIETYGFAPAFEKALTYLACNRPRFFGRIGKEVDPELLSVAECKLAMKAAQAIYADTGKGPEDRRFVVQRLQRWRYEGQVAIEKIHAVDDMLDEVEDAGVPDDDSVAAEVSPLLAHRINREALRIGAEELPRRGSLKKVVELANKAERIGRADTSPGSIVGMNVFREMAGLKYLERLSTGVHAWDETLEGGIPRGQFWLLGGGYGDGKSMGLTQFAAEGALKNMFVCYASLELSEELQKARYVANLTGELVNSLLTERHSKKTEEKLSWLLENRLGPISFKHFPGEVTSIDEVFEWVQLTEEFVGRPIDMLVIDYLDKLCHPKSQNDYQAMKYICGAALNYANNRKIWVFSATQLRRKEEKRKKKRADGDDVSDSIHKSRACDGLITLNPEKDEDSGRVLEMVFHTAKYRTGTPGLSSNPLPVDFARGRIVALHRDFDDDKKEAA